MAHSHALIAVVVFLCCAGTFLIHLNKSSDTKFLKAPPNISLTYIPSKQVIFKFFMEYVGIQPDTAVAAYLFSSAVKTVMEFASFAWKIVVKFFIVSIEINEYEDTYHIILTWLAEHPRGRNARVLLIYSDNGSMAGVQAWGPKPSTKYVPGYGTYTCLQGSQLFWITRTKEPVGVTYIDRRIIVSAFSSTTRPIRELIENCRITSRGTKTAFIKVRLRVPGEDYWRVPQHLPSKSLDMVILDRDMKSTILNDVKEFLDRKTWE